MLAWYGSGGGAIGDMLSQWEQAGFFTYLLPFLLIFALVFGLLEKTAIFKSRSIDGIIALVVGLMALQFEMVPQFFSEIFPRLGVALAILLVVLILIGLFADPDSNTVMYSLLGVGAIIAVIVLIKTAGAVGWSSGDWWGDNWSMIAGVVFILIIIGVIVGASNPSEDKSKSPFAQGLREMLGGKS